MGVDVLLAPAEKTGVGNAVRTAKHKLNQTNDNLSSLCHGIPGAIMSAIPELSVAEQQPVRRQLRALTKELEEAKTRSAKEGETMSEQEFLRDCRE